MTSRRPHVFLITADSLRHDRVDISGNNTHTPNLAKFAEESVKFQRSYATGPWTGSSLASLMTSLYPSQHGLLIRRENSEAKAPFINSPIHQDVPFLPSILRQHGYYTACFQGNVLFCNSRYRFTRGFDYYNGGFKKYSSKLHALISKPISMYREMNLSHLIRILGVEFLRRVHVGYFSNYTYFQHYYLSDAVTTRFTNFIKANAPGKPLFVWVHFLEPHCPYIPPQRHLKASCPTPDKREYYIRPMLNKDERLTQVQKQYIIGRYNAFVAFLDENFGRLIEALRWQRILDDSIVIFSSDHGEELFDHGKNRSDPDYYDRGCGHGHSQYEELIRVPLFIRMPGGSITHGVNTLVTNLDILPTLLELLSIDYDTTEMQGLSLTPLLHGADDLAEGFSDRTIFTEGIYFGTEKKAMIHDTRKIIWHCEEDVFEYYDLASDPGEKHGLFAQHQEEIAPLKERLVDWGKAMDKTFANASQGNVQRDIEVEKRLRALGYFE